MASLVPFVSVHGLLAAMAVVVCCGVAYDRFRSKEEGEEEEELLEAGEEA